MNILNRSMMLAVPALALTVCQAFAIDKVTLPMTNIVHFQESVCQVNCIDPHPSCEESQKVIDTLKKIYEAFGRKDLTAVASYIDDSCTTFEETGTEHKLLVGKKEVLEDIHRKMDEYGDDKDSPLLSYTIASPYAHVNGDTAVVTFLAYKVFGGKHPQKLESHCTDIFIKRDGKWLKTHYRSHWKQAA